MRPRKDPPWPKSATPKSATPKSATPKSATPKSATPKFGAADASQFSDVIAQMGEYFAATRTDFELRLAGAGTLFQRRVWAALRQIPCGTTASYGQIAERIGQPGAARAVGLANGANPIGIVVPCHRVVGADGRLTGYGGGLERKQFLLDLERRRATPDLFSAVHDPGVVGGEAFLAVPPPREGLQRGPSPAVQSPPCSC